MTKSLDIKVKQIEQYFEVCSSLITHGFTKLIFKRKCKERIELLRIGDENILFVFKESTEEDAAAMVEIESECIELVGKAAV